MSQKGLSSPNLHTVLHSGWADGAEREQERPSEIMSCSLVTFTDVSEAAFVFKKTDIRFGSVKVR